MAVDFGTWIERRDDAVRREAEDWQADYESCRRVLWRKLANAAHDFILCPDRACRRARQCRGHAAFPCRDVSPVAHDELGEQIIIDTAFDDLQQWRAATKGRRG